MDKTTTQNSEFGIRLRSWDLPTLITKTGLIRAKTLIMIELTRTS